jgi:hypothetical protein
VTICEACVALAVGALARGEATPGGEVPFPPRLFGYAPDERAVGDVEAVFRLVFGGPRDPGALSAAMEDAEELEPHLLAAGQRHSVRPSSARVERLRFLDDDTVDVSFVINLQGGPGSTFVGRGLRRNGRWLVARETVVDVLRRAGVGMQGPGGVR